MGFTEKVAVTLPKEDVRQLQQVEAARGVAFSAVVRGTVETWLRIQREQELRDKYRRYYAAPRVRAQAQTLARQMARASAHRWPAD